ncbi:MAG: SDR family oxidoreductase, partial [Pseudomonadota bacterium]
MTPSPRAVFVAGAARGIGLGFVEALLARPDTAHVYAAARTASRSEGLATLQNVHPERLICIDLDITDEDSLAAAANTVAGRVDRDDGALDWIINTVGMLHNGELQPERRLADVTAGNILASFEVNSVGPVLLAKHLAPLLPRRAPGVLATLSARVGSIADNRLGGWYSYRAAKAAQNMLTRTLAIELKRRHRSIRCVALHPGTVITDLSAPFRGNSQRLFTVTAAGMRQLHAAQDVRRKMWQLIPQLRLG